MNHHYRQMPVAVRGNLVLHVHLVDGDIAAAEWRVASRRSGHGLYFSADEKAALTLDDQRLRLHRSAHQHKDGGHDLA